MKSAEEEEEDKETGIATTELLECESWRQRGSGICMLLRFLFWISG